MKDFLFLLLPLLFSLSVSAQDTTVTFYFKSGQSHLLDKQKKVVASLQSRPISKMTLEGYADTVGKASANKKLSYKRADRAAQAFSTANKEVSGRGESKEKHARLSDMRKVVVKVWYEKQEKTAEATVLVPPATKAVADSCKGDTTLYYESGTHITMNKCYYQKIKHCFKYNEYLSASRVQQAGLRTVDERGDPILSGGMISVAFCADTCLLKPIIVFIPVPECLKGSAMTLWNLTRNNTWRNSRNKIEVVKIKGREYYKMFIYCPGFINCDKPCIRKPKKMKIKLKNGLRFKSASLSYQCPLYSVEGKLKKNKRKAIFPYICPNSEPLLYAKVYNKKGDTLIIDNRNINEYTRRRKLASYCVCTDKSKERFLGLFKIKRRYLYRKYKLYRKDFP